MMWSDTRWTRVAPGDYTESISGWGLRDLMVKAGGGVSCTAHEAWLRFRIEKAHYVMKGLQAHTRSSTPLAKGSGGGEKEIGGADTCGEDGESRGGRRGWTGRATSQPRMASPHSGLLLPKQETDVAPGMVPPSTFMLPGELKRLAQ